MDMSGLIHLKLSLFDSARDNFKGFSIRYISMHILVLSTSKFEIFENYIKKNYLFSCKSSNLFADMRDDNNQSCHQRSDIL